MPSMRCPSGTTDARAMPNPSRQSASALRTFADCSESLGGMDNSLIASEPELCDKSRRESQGRADACNAGEPSEMVEQLAKHGAPDQAPKEIASEIGSAGNPAVCPCRLPDEASSAGLRKKGPDPDQHHPGEHIRKVR